MKNRVLIILVIALAGVYLLLEVFDKNPQESTMLSTILTADTALIDKMVFYPEMMNREEVVLEKTAGTWTVAHEGKSYHADPSTIQMILTTLKNSKVEQLVGTKEEDWSKFELTADQATSVVIEAGGKRVADLFLGGFDFNETTQIPTTYLRVKDDVKSYSVSGYLDGSFNRDVNAFRLRTITELDAASFTRVSFEYPADSSFTLSKNNDIWFSNMQACDSVAVSTYLSSLSRMGSTNFVSNDVDVSSLSGDFVIRIEGEGFEPVEITAFTGHPTYSTVIQSSTHPDGLWDGGASELFSRHFVSPRRFDLKE